MTIQEHQTRV